MLTKASIFCLLIATAWAIKFDYVAQKHQFICFQQDIEKQTRYQVIVMANKPSFTLQLIEQQRSVFEDDRSDLNIKQYSAYSQVDGVLMICLANGDYEEEIAYSIQFDHGLNLDVVSIFGATDAFSSLDRIHDEAYQMQQFVRNGYDMNVRTLIARNEKLSGVGFMLTLTTIISIFMICVTRTILMSRLKKLLKARKLI